MIDLKKGDCLELMKEIPDESVDMVLCDLPYQVTKNEWDKQLPLDKIWECYGRIIKNNGAIILFGSQPFTTDLINSKRDWFKYCWVWDKVNPSGMGFAKYQPMRRTEDILVFCKDGNRTNYYPIMEKRDKPMTAVSNGKRSNSAPSTLKPYKKTWNYRNPTTILKYTKISRGAVHPTQKPVKLLEYLVKTYTQENDVVLDNCMGSGSTGVACINTNRNFIGHELQQDYFKIAEKRISDAIDARGLFATDEQIARQKH